MLGLDASLVLCYRDEYKQCLKEQRGNFEVLLAHEWLITEIHKGNTLNLNGCKNDVKYKLFAHCTEKTALANSENEWIEIFSAFDLTLEKISVGCCGMAGTYGHEKSNLENSKGLFQLSWQPKLAKLSSEQVLATGFSCRSQVKRLGHERARHPIEALLQCLN